MEKLPEIDEQGRIENIKRLERARICFEDTFENRQMRQRTFKYYTGDQWGDTMEDPDNPGSTITEEDYIKRQGRLPAKQNLMGKTIRSIVGQFRTNYPDPVAFGRTRSKAQAGEMMTSALQYALDINEANELDARNMEEFGVGGAAGWKVGYKWWSGLNREDIYMSNIDVTRLFYNTDATDIRSHDIRFIGELHDMTLDQVINRFGFRYRDRDKLKKLFPESGTDWDIHNTPQHVQKFRNFYIPDNPDKLRVIEVWEQEYEDQTFLHDTKDGSFERVTKEYFIEQGYEREIIDSFSLPEFVELLNQARIEEAQMQGVDPVVVPRFKLHERYEEVWRVYFLTPNGDLLMSMDTPYDHGEHPYIYGRYMMDGKVMSLGESIIDQQRHVNRLISMMDAALGRSLKQVMMIDEQSIPAQYKGDFQAYADDMVKANGMVLYTSRNGKAQMPKEIRQNAVPADAKHLLTMQAELLKDISAVTDAVQGKQPQSGTPASLYAQQTLNATVTNKDIFDFYFSLIRKRNRKVVHCIKQFYDEPRHIKISGTGFNSGVDNEYDPEEVKDVDFDVVIGESQNTLAYRQTVDTELKEFLGAQMITFEEYLKTTSMPYADKLLQTIQNRSEQPGQAGGEEMSEEEMQQMMLQQQEQQGSAQ